MKHTLPVILIIFLFVTGYFSCRKFDHKDLNDPNLKVTVKLDTIYNITLESAIIKGSILVESQSNYIGQYWVDYDTSTAYKSNTHNFHSCPGRGVTSVSITDTIKKLKENTLYYARIRIETATVNPPGGCFYSDTVTFFTLKQPLQVTGLKPDSGTYRDVITIQGIGFNKNIIDNVVEFNGVRATVIKSWNDSLKAIVPKKCGSGQVTVKIGNESVSGLQFKYTDEPYVVYTLAGGTAGFEDGLVAKAKFHLPLGIILDNNNNIFIADALNHCIRKITPDGVVSTFAGSGVAGYLDGNASSAQFYATVGLFIDKTTGNLFVSETRNSCIRIVSSSGNVSTLAGSTIQGYVDDWGTRAQFNMPSGIVGTSKGYFFVADKKNNRIRKIDQFGNVSTFAGKGTCSSAEGKGVLASTGNPLGIIADSNDNLYVLGCDGETLFKVDTTGMVSILVGTSKSSCSAQWDQWIGGITLDSDNNIYFIADNCIKKYTPSGEVTVFAGDSTVSAVIDAGISRAKFKNLSAITMDNDGNFYITDDNCIRKIEKVE